LTSSLVSHRSPHASSVLSLFGAKAAVSATTARFSLELLMIFLPVFNERLPELIKLCLISSRPLQPFVPVGLRLLDFFLSVLKRRNPYRFRAAGVRVSDVANAAVLMAARRMAARRVLRTFSSIHPVFCFGGLHTFRNNQVVL
jgi:hypothetical protein